MSVAFFLSEIGHLIHVHDTHIGTIIRDPERFGLKRKQIEAVYLKHGEPVGLEGEARRELLLQIIKRGWIRIRRHRNYWSVTADTLAPAVQDILQIWAARILDGIEGFKELDRYISVRISTSEGDFRCTIEDLPNGSYLERRPPGDKGINENAGFI